MGGGVGTEQNWKQAGIRDQRILGNGDFMRQVLEEMDDIGRENLRLTTRRMDLACVGTEGMRGSWDPRW